jgi:acetyltransferase-like isoleucine patch superfamily enzyme
METNAARKPLLTNHSGAGIFADDPLSVTTRVLSKLRTIWMGLTYPFARFGRGVSIHYSADIRRSGSNRISIGDSVYIARDTWLSIPKPAIAAEPAIILESGCKIGRRCTISASNLVHLGADALLGPSVFITDHSHEFSNPELPIHAQGLTAGGTIIIGPNCWLGHGAAIICTSGILSIGRNSIIGANSVVTHSVPPFCVAVGSPARIVRRYDAEHGKWIKGGLS